MRKKPEQHGLSGSKVGIAWSAMMNRCYCKTSDAYPYYGGRGISVCEPWRLSVAQFYKDIGEAPSPKHSIDRIDVDGNYEPGNVRWADWKQQMGNRRCNHLIERNGRRMTLTQAAEELGMLPVTLHGRLREGWTLDEALSTPVQEKHLLTFDGVSKPLAVWARERGIPETTVHNRLKNGWSAERALSTKSRRFLTITWDGKTLTIPQWAKLIGIDRSSLRDRLAKGWSVERALTTPPR